MMDKKLKYFGCVVACFLLFPPIYSRAGEIGYKHRPALVFAGASTTMILGAALAGNRIVAVGNHGAVLLSDDQGKTFRQAKGVPTSVMVDAVSFADAKNGWAVGHLGVIIHSTDGGETWTMQPEALSHDEPLFTVWFKNDSLGFAAGLWGMLIKTVDGGKTWQQVKLPPLPDGRKDDRNLFAIFPDRLGNIFIAAERGTLFKSEDGGLSWKLIDTGNKGSLWAGVALQDGSLVVAGLRGKILRSRDDGEHWTVVHTGTKSSITGLTELSDGRIVAVGLDGVTLESANEGGYFHVVSRRPDRMDLTAVVAGGPKNDAAVVFSANGPVAAPQCH
ncbi:MAG: YCF48-related protein [Syntrophobacteraceae bacterium]|nr:YCF48-related protein [Syntrophobacteraceae bacterium]